MKTIALILPSLLAASMSFAQEGGGAPAAAAPAPTESNAMMAAPKSASPKNYKEAKKACKEQASGDKKAFKKCMADFKKK